MRNEKDRDELDRLLEQGHFLRAAEQAVSMGLDQDRIHEIQREALWQMAAVYRNDPGTKKLAEKYGFSKKQVVETLSDVANMKREKGEEKPMRPCYNEASGKYLTFEEWLEQFAKNWGSL